MAARCKLLKETHVVKAKDLKGNTTRKLITNFVKNCVLKMLTAMTHRFITCKPQSLSLSNLSFLLPCACIPGLAPSAITS